jgi:hypothetical protein
MTAFPVAAGTRQAASMTAATTAVAVRLPRKYVRSPQLLVWSVAGGAIFIVLFRYIFGGSIRFGSLPYVDFLMPGMILTSVLVNGAGTAIGVAEDREQGFFDRLRSLRCQPSRASNIITTESPIRISACPMPPSGPGRRASSCAPKAALAKSIRRAVSGEMIQGVTVP